MSKRKHEDDNNDQKPQKRHKGKKSRKGRKEWHTDADGESFYVRWKTIKGSDFEVSRYGDVRHKYTGNYPEPHKHGTHGLVVSVRVDGQSNHLSLARLMETYFPDSSLHKARYFDDDTKPSEVWKPVKGYINVEATAIS